MQQSGTSHRTTDNLRARLEASRSALLEAISGLDEAGFRAQAPPSEQTVPEHLADLLSKERDRLLKAESSLSGESPAASESSERAGHSPGRMVVPQVLHGLLAQRRDTVRLLERLSPEEPGTEAALQHIEQIAVAEEERAAIIQSLRLPKRSAS